MLPEDSYGTRKRLDYLCELVKDQNINYILDVGCGSGNVSLSLAKIFPTKHFIAIDEDSTSINYAKKHSSLKNLQFLITEELNDNQEFDFIIVSEVIEHVEDPIDFLLNIRSRLKPDGQIFMSLPNGYGPFEWGSLIESILRATGIYVILRKLKNKFSQLGNTVTLDTYAISPHINFFSYKTIKKIISVTGFKIHDMRSRTFLCGFGFDQFVQAFGLIEWNAKIADRVSVHLVSDWMFLLILSGEAIKSFKYQRTSYACCKRKLNEYCIQE